MKVPIFFSKHDSLCLYTHPDVPHHLTWLFRSVFDIAYQTVCMLLSLLTVMYKFVSLYIFVNIVFVRMRRMAYWILK